MLTSRTAILAAAVCFTTSSTFLFAQTPARGSRRGAAAEIAPAAASAEVAALKPAFETLLSADHDYQGHRVKAMRAIAQACRLLGTDILPADFEQRIKAHKEAATQPATKPATRPGKPEPEPQSTSDAQLKQAQATVQQVLSSIPAGTQPRITERLQEAVTELNTALSLK